MIGKLPGVWSGTEFRMGIRYLTPSEGSVSKYRYVLGSTWRQSALKDRAILNHPEVGGPTDGSSDTRLHNQSRDRNVAVTTGEKAIYDT
jgi:hypothetical protein